MLLTTSTETIHFAAQFENLKEVLSSKEVQFEQAIAEAHSKADWDIMQLRHLLDKSDITYANKIEEMTQRYESEKGNLRFHFFVHLQVTLYLKTRNRPETVRGIIKASDMMTIESLK